MDTRTAAALFAIDLATRIDVATLAASTIPAWYRGLALSLVTVDLDRIDCADRPEADKLLRAVRAAVRRQQGLGYVRRLPRRAAGA